MYNTYSGLFLANVLKIRAFSQVALCPHLCVPFSDYTVSIKQTNLEIVFETVLQTGNTERFLG